MILTRVMTAEGIRWCADGRALPGGSDLSLLLSVRRDRLAALLDSLANDHVEPEAVLAPLDDAHEVWAAGVTYERSRSARKEESDGSDVYDRVYNAERPELFFKSLGHRVVGHGGPIRIRADSTWNVPEPELTLVINKYLEVVGFCAGNDVSSRSVEGENPLYLPQAKSYDGACALGPGIVLIHDVSSLAPVAIRLQILREQQAVLDETVSTSQLARPLDELVEYLGRELTFNRGVFLMTGTGIVPPNDFTLRAGDTVVIEVDRLKLENVVQGARI